MIKDMAWNMFKSTGSVDTFLNEGNNNSGK